MTRFKTVRKLNETSSRARIGPEKRARRRQSPFESFQWLLEWTDASQIGATDATDAATVENKAADTFAPRRRLRRMIGGTRTRHKKGTLRSFNQK